MWFKSSYSSPSGSCVEVDLSTSRVLVRDSKNGEGGVLSLSSASWRSFIERASA
jgi:hypothetical protein